MNLNHEAFKSTKYWRVGDAGSRSISGVRELTFQSRNTSRARIRTPARAATSMIHHGIPVCCATERSGDTVNVTWNHHPNKREKVRSCFGQQSTSKMKSGDCLKVQNILKKYILKKCIYLTFL